MKSIVCCNPACYSQLDVTDATSEEEPNFCSLECSIADGWRSRFWEEPANKDARQTAWRIKQKQRLSAKE